MSARSLAASASGYGLIGLGFLAGWVVASHPKLEPFKVLNIIGLTYDLLGVVVLSELAAQSERVKHFIVRHLSGAVLWAQLQVPLGAAAGAILNFGAPSASVAASLFLSIWAWSCVPLALLELGVRAPILRRFEDLTLRSRVFGLLLLLAGGVVQLIAACKDLYA